VAEKRKRGFELAVAGAALGCAHSNGTLGFCYIGGFGVASTKRGGLRWEGRVRRRTAASGSLLLECATTLVVAALRHAQDYAEAVRLYSHAVPQGNAAARNPMAEMFVLCVTASCQKKKPKRE
jgi:hypothetical protein